MQEVMKNVIVVMFDSLQYNYLGCYGNEWIKTPHFDRLAREGVLFENCYTEGLPTVPCRRAMHTGRYTLQKSGWVALTMEDTTIADLCWGRPIDTALIFDCPMYRLAKFGYTRGFDKVWFTHGHEADHMFYARDVLYHKNPMDYIEQHQYDEGDKIMGGSVIAPLMDELTCYLKQRQYWTSDEDRYVAKTMKKAVEYLEQVDRNKQFFLWVDSFDPHEPWDPPSVYLNFPCPYDPDYQGKDLFVPIMGPTKDLFTEPELRHIRMLYAELVSVCDKWLGYLLDNIRRLGFEENTLLLQVSDHGEPLGNGEHGHGIMRKCRPWPYEELVHTPMIMRGPGIPAGIRCKAYVQSCDVAPTVCDWLGIGVHPDMQGKSLLPLARGEADKVRDFSVAGYHKFSWAMYTDDWSFIHWLNRADNQSQEDVIHDMYTHGMAEAMGDSIIVDDPLMSASMKRKTPLNEADKALRDAASLDGEEQWTCTPGSVAEVPEQDELYDRRADPFQLNNVAARHPEVCRDLLKKLRLYMQDLAAS